MTITVVATPDTLDPEECTNFDLMALRRRAITFTKAGATPAAAKADVDAMPAAIQVYTDAIATAEDDLALAIAGEVTGTSAAPTTYLDQPEKDAFVAAAVATLDAAKAALPAARDAAALAKNAAWWGQASGVPIVADISGVDNA